MGETVKKKKNHVVYAVTEEGTVYVYGPYSRSKAEKVVSDVFEEDGYDKVFVETTKLRKFRKNS